MYIREIIVKESGINNMTPGDVGMVFYITVHNTSDKKYEINVKMLQCIESISESEQELDAMDIIGGYMGTLNAKSVKKLTLIFPNMYLYNRKGKCTFAIYYTDHKHQTRELETCVKFNTSPDTNGGDVPKVVRDYYRGQRVRYCETVDMDPLENCKPVDCLMKYSGRKSYFNEKCKLCQQIPVCVSHGDDADVAYIPSSNRCRNLGNCISDSDINLLEEGFVINNTDRLYSSRGILVRCNNHGQLDNTTGVCQCTEGWTSAETDVDQYLPGVSMYHMCNVRVDSWDPKSLAKIRNTLLAFAILAVLISIIALLVTFCLHALLTYFKRRDQLTPLYDIVSCTKTNAVELCGYNHCD
ncbi:uncharacterized protein CBL_03797 [Carabus blaptoides fortunei]